MQASPIVPAVLAAIVTAVSLPCSSGQDRPGESMLARIDRIVEEAMAGSGATGIVVAVEIGGEPFLERCYGTARPDSLFRVGALCDPLVAVALLHLSQEGMLDLEADVSTYLLGFSWEGEHVRVRDLLAHTSGLPSYESFLEAWKGRHAGTEKAARPASAADEIDEIVRVLASLSLDATPGSCFTYEHTNDMVAAALLARVSGKTLSDGLAEWIFEPLEMEATVFGGSESSAVGDEEREIAGESMTLPHHADLFGEPGLHSNAPDLLTWMRGLVGRTLLDEPRWRLLTEPVVLPDGEKTLFGLGMGRSTLEEHEAIVCGGALAGHRVHLAHYLDLGITAVVLTDHENTPAERVERRVLRAILDLPEPGVHDWPLAKEDLERYAGDYQMGCTRLEVRIAGDHLTLAGATEHPLLRLLHQGRNEFVAGIDPEIRLAFQLEEGRAKTFVLDDHGMSSTAIRFGD